MAYLDNIVFLIATVFAGWYFSGQFKQVLANIRLGRPESREDKPQARLQTMLRVAFGQQKMFANLIPAVLHGFIYVGFLVINVELVEILIDGIFGTHRVLSFMGPLYSLLTGVNEILGFLVIIASLILLYRRNVLKIKRFSGIEMKNFSFVDANTILITEIVLMKALFLFNIADVALTNLQGGELHGWFPVSSLFTGFFGENETVLTVLREIGWWGHILGIYLFLNYIPKSKHFHIMMAFPNTYFSKLTPMGKLTSSEQIFHEVKAAFDPSYQVPVIENAPKRFGALDVTDLTWKNLMDSYACTECGRCTAVCPANTTGKKLSPRKIIMDTRDRLEEIQKFQLAPDENGLIQTSTPSELAVAATANTLLSDTYISNEELWACTTCNACADACPVNIDHVSTIIELRRYLAMEKSEMPDSWARMFSNIENNGAPWAVPAAARYDWAMDVEMPA